MKKMTKLLSVILAFVMALSCMTMMASAAKTNYQTVKNLEDLNAYSPYGTVTRLATEERVSILMDSLDILLAKANINMGTVLDALGLKITINLTSVDNLCASFDTFKSTMSNGLYGLAKVFVDLGILESLKFDSWQAGMNRDNTAQLTILNEILEILSTNTAAINTVLTDGLKLGMIKNFLSGVSVSGISELTKNLPNAIRGIVLPMFGRPDDDKAQRDKLSNRSTDLMTTAQSFVNGLFTKPMNWTSYRTDASGNSLGYTTALPTEANGTSRYFVINGDSITQFDYQYEGILGDPEAGYKETVTYTKAKEYDSDDCTTYVYRAPENYSGDQTLKWYKAENIADANGNIQSGYWLPTVRDAMINNGLTLEINGNDSLLGLLYKFIPYIFAEMAPTVLNGSAKKLIAEAFDVKFVKIGLKNEQAVKDVATATGNPNSFFTKAQEYYTWEYSDYTVIDGVPYYRYQDTYFKGEIPNNISVYYNIFNWDWNVGDDFFNQFIPSTVGSSWIVDNLSAIVEKAIKTMIADTWTARGVTYNRDTVFAFADRNGDGKVDNADLLENIMYAARAFFQIAPEEILDDYYKEAQFYTPMMEGTLKQAVNGLVCELVKLIMPQIKFSDDIIDQPITAIAAIVVRELCTQLMPTYNFDAMIYANYGKAGAPTRALASHTADEWLDITLYMGVNLGMYYLRNIADVGEDQPTGYFTVMSNLGAIPANTPNGMNFGANAYKTADGTASWLVAIDWIVDWALDANTEWCWHFERLVNVDGAVDLATYQNPFNKINKVITTFIPALNTLLNLDGLSGNDYGSGTLVEKILKDGLVDSIVNLDLTTLLGILKVPTGSAFRQTQIADTLVQMIVEFLNSVTYKVCGGANLINGSTITSVDTLINHANLRTVIISLVGKLYAASNTYNIFDPIMPIVNFFIGWKTDPQKYSEPEIYFSNAWGSTYLHSTNTPVLKFTNSSSGMLLKHRNSSTVDNAYTITVHSVTLDAGVSTTQGFPVTVVPGQTANITLSLPADTSTVVEATVSYSYTGKDGKPLGGVQTKSVYGYVSALADQLNEKVAGVDKDYTMNADYKKFEFTEDIYDAVVNYEATVFYKSDPTGIGAAFNSSKACKSVGTNGANVTAPASNYFQHITSVSEAGFKTVYKDDTVAKPSTSSGKLYKAKSGVTANTEFPYGVYDMGKTTVKYNSSGKDYEIDFIYYNDYDIEKVYDKYTGYNLQASSFEDQAAWNTYETALKKVVELALVAKRIDYVDTVQPQIENAIAALETAHKALMSTSSSSSTGDVSLVEAKLAALETNPDRDINFQDYALFEYFKYENERTSARKMINSTKAPALPESYIENGVWGDDIIAAIVNAQANANVKAGINATVVPTTDPERAEEMAKARKAIADFKPATYTDLAVDDQVSKLQYYYDFMAANTKTIDRTFLNNEIAYAEAQNYKAADYSADSWARYTEALAKAKAAQSSNKESLIFDAKYELMLAQNKLEKHSMKESGYMNEELVPLIEHANAIINNYGTLYTVKDTVAYADAFAQLVRALGVKYNVNLDGKDVEGILYDRSAITFTEYDRTDSVKNKRAVDLAADALRAAIENFECTAKIESNNTVTTVDQSIRYIQGIVPNSLPTSEALLGKVNVVGTATPVVTASKAGNFGTGARIELKDGDTLLAIYFVVIYGDVNGDGAVDGFDALEVDMSNHTAYYMGDVYDDAADINHDGIVNADDYAAIKTSVKCSGTISQTL